MVNFIKFIEQCPRGGKDLIKGFTDFCDKGQTRLDCEDCISQCLLQRQQNEEG
jgi:DtxR family Mn-dependent transcriptional regulator